MRHLRDMESRKSVYVPLCCQPEAFVEGKVEKGLSCSPKPEFDEAASAKAKENAVGAILLDNG